MRDSIATERLYMDQSAIDIFDAFLLSPEHSNSCSELLFFRNSLEL